MAVALAVPTLAAVLGLYALAALIVFGGAFLVFLLPAMLYEDQLNHERRVPLLNADRAGVTFGERLVLRRARIDASSVEPLADGGCQVQLRLIGATVRADMRAALVSAAAENATDEGVLEAFLR